MDALLKINNVRYKNILNDISFALQEKTFNVLIGPNGSGKTTLIKSIVGLIKYEGNIVFLGNIIDNSNIDNLRKNIGILLDDNFLLNGTSLYNITYPLLNLNYEEASAKKKAYELSKRLGIDNLLIKDIDELTLSEKKMVAFASSVVHEPKLIIIDDSFDELDSYYRKKILNYLKKQNKSTVLFITHNQEDILLADNLIIMNDGKIVEYGKMKDLVNQERIFIKNNIKLPFIVDLSHKLKAYELINDVIYNKDEMIEEIWK